MVSDHYASLGFSLVSRTEADAVWRLDLADGYKQRNKFIEVTPFADIQDGSLAGNLSGRA